MVFNPDKGPAPKSNDPKSRGLRRNLKKDALLVPAFFGLAGKAEANLGYPDKSLEIDRQAIKDLSFTEGAPERAPIVGKFSTEMLKFVLLILPRNIDERMQYQAFLRFMHNEEFDKQGRPKENFRGFIAGQMETMHRFHEEFSKRAWKFYKDYFKGGNKEFKPVVSMRATIGSGTRHFPSTNEVLIDREEELVPDWPFGISALHETHHAASIFPKKDGHFFEDMDSSSASEIISFFDAAVAAMIDKSLRAEKGLPKNGAYEKEARLPNGKTFKISKLLSLLSRFYENKDGSLKTEGMPNFIELLATKPGVSFFSDLIYNHPGRNGELCDRLDKVSKDFIAQKESFEENKVSVIKGYIEQFEKIDPKRAKDYAFDLEHGYSGGIDGIHRELVMMLRIMTDPIYEFHEDFFKVENLKNGKKNPIKGIRYLTVKSEQEALFKVAREGDGVKEFWEDKVSFEAKKLNDEPIEQ